MPDQDVVQSQVTVNNGSNKTGSSLFNSFSPARFVVFILIILALASVYAYTRDDKDNKDNNLPISVTPAQAQIEALAPYTIVYGNWVENMSRIKAYDLSTQTEYIVADLPVNIKNVTILSPEKLLYIGETDSKDHGKNISVYNLLTKTSSVMVSSSDDFGIDDYVISGDKKYLSTWEVSFAENSTTLENGRSRVYSVNLNNPATKNLIYDEQRIGTANPAHYPRAITSGGEIFLDTFVPNTGAGWAYGMSTSNFDGTVKENLEKIKNGTYSTQPHISKDEKQLIFSGYDGTDGKVLDKGFRKSILNPNTVEVYDIAQKERKKLSEFTNDNIYPFVSIDNEGNIVLTVIPKENSNLIRIQVYKPASGKIDIVDNIEQEYIASLANGKILSGKKNLSSSSLGNLGKNYSGSYENLSILNLSDNNINTLKLTDATLQFIEITPSNYFKNVKEVVSNSEKTLQLQTFSFKPSLAPQRETQQTVPPPENNLPPCHQLFPQFCNAADSSERDFTCKTYMRDAALRGECYDSPLYLYGTPGTNINVKVKTYVYNSDPLYNPDTGYNVTLLEDGKMQINGNIYNRINYDYIGKNTAAPDYGITVPKRELSEAIKYYTKKLGLNEKEKNDLINYADKNIQSPYIFISFYDEQTSKQILPLEFIPRPDTYINIVFYFKQYDHRPSFNPKPPVFKTPPARNGFTAVEISEVLE